MEEAKRSPGRPKALPDNERRHRILEAATALFIEDGYDATDMKRIAERCGMSKKTLYLMFQSKDDLFATLICDPESRSYGPDTGNLEGPAQDQLTELLCRLGLWVLSPNQIGLTRLVIAEAKKSPDLARQFRDRAVSVGQAVIRAHLATMPLSEGSGLSLDDLASMLFGASVGELQLRALAGEDISALTVRAALYERNSQLVRLFAMAFQ